MSETPHDIHFALTEFDREELPESQRELTGDDFRQAVQEHLASQFSGQGDAAVARRVEDATPRIDRGGTLRGLVSICNGSRNVLKTTIINVVSNSIYDTQL